MKIAKITTYADDQQQMKLFWTEKLGFEVIAENQMGPNMTWIEVGSKALAVTVIIYDRALMNTQNPEMNTNSPHIMFTTSNAKQEYERLESCGVHVFEYQEMPYGTMFQFSDIEGNKYVVRED